MHLHINKEKKKTYTKKEEERKEKDLGILHRRGLELPGIQHRMHLALHCLSCRHAEFLGNSGWHLCFFSPSFDSLVYFLFPHLFSCSAMLPMLEDLLCKSLAFFLFAVFALFNYYKTSTSTYYYPQKPGAEYLFCFPRYHLFAIRPNVIYQKHINVVKDYQIVSLKKNYDLLYVGTNA